MLKLLENRGLMLWADIASPTGGSGEGREFEFHGVLRGLGFRFVPSYYTVSQGESGVRYSVVLEF